jgi:serine/threonine protein kinase
MSETISTQQDDSHISSIILSPSPISNELFSFPSPVNTNSIESISFTDTSEFASDDFYDETKQRKRFQIKHEIGRGGMGRVYLALDSNTGKDVAIKKVFCDSALEVNRAMAEVWPVRQLNHEHLVSYEDVFFEGDDAEKFVVCIVMEYFNMGDLHQEIQRRAQSGNHFDQIDALVMMQQITSGIAYLHEKNLLHRDIKPMNIFRCKNNMLKIGDFGLVKSMEHTEAKTTAGTHRYMSPEIFRKDQKYSFKADVWSLGVVFLEILLLGIDVMPYLEIYMNRSWHNEIETAMLSKNYSKKIVNLVLQCLELEEHSRISTNNLLEELNRLYDQKELLDVDIEAMKMFEYAELYNKITDSSVQENFKVQDLVKYRDIAFALKDDPEVLHKLAVQLRYFDLIRELLKQGESVNSLSMVMFASAYQFSVYMTDVSRAFRLRFCDGGGRSIIGLAQQHPYKDIRELAAAMLTTFVAFAYYHPEDNVIYETLQKRGSQLMMQFK